MKLLDDPNALQPLPPGERSFLGIIDDPYYRIESFPDLFAPGHAQPLMAETDTIFRQPLALLRCGLIVLASQVPTLAREKDPARLKDIRDVLTLAWTLRGALWSGAASARYAPFLFENTSAQEMSVEAALVKTLDVAVADYQVTPVDAQSFSLDFENGISEIGPDDRLTGYVLKYEGSELAEEVAKVAQALAFLSQFRQVRLGIKGDRPLFYETPIFLVGRTPSNRLAGLLTTFVD